MKPRVVIGSDLVEITPGGRVPRKGLALRGTIVYEDGRELGIATATRAHAAVQTVLDVRGEYVEIRYVPTREALKAPA